jgi:hypothetical protein
VSFDAVTVNSSLLAVFPRCNINLILVILNTRQFPVQEADFLSSVETVLNSGCARLDLGLCEINYSFLLCIVTLYSLNFGGPIAAFT